MPEGERDRPSSPSKLPGVRPAARLSCALLLAACVAPLPAPAAAPKARPTVELTPFAGFRFGGGFDESGTENRLTLDSAMSFGGIVSFRVGPTSWLEVAYSRQDSEVAAPPSAGPRTIDVKVEYLSGGGLYEFSLDDFRPFLAASVGATRFSSDDPGTSSTTNLAFGLSGGFKYEVVRNLRLRFEGRLWFTVTESGTAALCQDGSCVLVFGASGFWQGDVLAGVSLAF